MITIGRRLQDSAAALRMLLVFTFLISYFSFSTAQIVIGGNVYGGGNEGATGGSTTVTVHAGDINRVFGGARMANVGGSSFVHLDGEHASNYILINYVFGGNDIAGTIGSSSSLPSKLTRTTENGIDASWNAFVRISSKLTTPAVYYTQAEINAADEDDDAYGKTISSIKTPAVIADNNQKIYVGQLFAGGNGNYEYTGDLAGKSAPNLARTYLEILGGSIVNAFGGGNKATVTDSTVIYVDNPSNVVNSIIDANNPNADTNGELLTYQRTVNKTNGMGLNPGYTYATSAAYQIGSFFGGNNLVDMAIRPAWNLQNGKIRNIYSGGNKGGMTSLYGVLLEIPNGSFIEADNVFGGCRKADVCPGGDRENPIAVKRITGYKFPDELSARVLVRSGNINNVYGGNDISGHVYGGSAVGIYTSINGNVYGGGNGSYPYTDNKDLKDDPVYGDLYYGDGTNPFANDQASVEALNEFRPNAEQTSIRLAGTEKKHTVIGGAVYCGGNSATLKNTRKQKPLMELKIGSYVYADKVFLGNNGEEMVQINEQQKDENGVITKHEGVLRTMANTTLTSNHTKFNSITLTNEGSFADYMKGCELSLMPSVVFDNEDNNDPATYIPYTSYIGSLFFGGNRGSMNVNGCTTLDLNKEVVIFDKVVGGCNDADIPEQWEGENNTGVKFNAAFSGGLIGTPPQLSNDPNEVVEDVGVKLKMNLSGLKIQPKRWKKNGNGETVKDANGNPLLEWNTIYSSTGVETPPILSGSTGLSTPEDLDRRLKGGNIYGGCYTSGHVNGDVVINLNATLIERDLLFDEVQTDGLGEEEPLYGTNLLNNEERFNILERHTGVLLGQQGMDVLGKALNVFGGGYGKNTEIWGSTTINLNAGYTFQIFGGSEQGVIGKPDNSGTYTFNGKKYKQSDEYSCYINMHNAEHPGVSKKADSSPDMAEAEFIYGGGFFGLIAGNTKINLGNGRVFNTFGGSCYGDILGHTETYIGGDGTLITGFPYIRDYLYGGNDLGGDIIGSKSFANRLRAYDENVTDDPNNFDIAGKVYKNSGQTASPVLTASSYVEYTQGRALGIFGGHFGTYDYANKYQAYTNKPYLGNAFVNFRPLSSSVLKLPEKNNVVNTVYGGSQGEPGDTDRDVVQESSYVLIDIPQDMENYQNMEVFGAGAWSGMGMKSYVAPKAEVNCTESEKAALDGVSAIIDLARGQIKAAYGGSFKEGFTRRTVVNVPAGSTIDLWNIFGGAYGASNDTVCDVYESNVNYNSALATVHIESDENNVVTKGGVYGGNNNCRRTIYSKVNINSKVVKDQTSGYTSAVLGAGSGKDTWAQYTEVNINDNGNVWETYGGGLAGRVMNEASLTNWVYDEAHKETNPMTIDLTINQKGTFANDGTTPSTYSTGLDNPLVTAGHYNGTKYNSNVFICGSVGGYCYGGGRGFTDIPTSGDVYGTTNIELLGGYVGRDLYAAGTNGSVMDKFGVGNATFIASANAYIEGGMVRNVYGGGWRGSVGYHNGAISATTTGDIDGQTNVVIGKLGGGTYTYGIPSITRNVYGGGEGGAIYGTANILVNNGYIGYRYDTNATNDPTTDFDERYKEELDDKVAGDNDLDKGGNVFGGGYVANSYVDKSNVIMYGGEVRGCLFGGGEVGPIGRGTVNSDAPNGTFTNGAAKIYKAGETNVTLYEGHVHRDVFGGGRGYDNWDGEGWMTAQERANMDLSSKGYVFGKTQVNIFGGEVGTEEGIAIKEDGTGGYGNVFGGGDRGFVYSGSGTKDGERYDNNKEGYYYYDDDVSGKTLLSEDCKVLIAPYCRVESQIKKVEDEVETYVDVPINGTSYPVGAYVPIEDLNHLKDKATDAAYWNCLNTDGIVIHNAVFAGGNVSSGNDEVSANVPTVFGNASASIYDVYHRDLITIGSGHTGGLYGDGNLTFVDGYRGLNITNYGTDYYHLSNNLNMTQFNALSSREQAYYEIKFKCLVSCTDKNGKTYAVGDVISSTDLLVLFEEVTDGVDGDNNPIYIVDPTTHTVNGTYWQENGVYSKYAGRIMNTIQRADFCGVFGSRMVLQGAPDRVPEEVDYTNYTINRVRELSLNKKNDTGTANAYHGNYFGIYNIVNFLGALTSDVNFTDVRTTDNTNHETYDADYDPTNATITITETNSDKITKILEEAGAIDGVTVSGSTITATTVEGLYKLRSVSGLNIVAQKLTNQTYYDWKELHHTEKKRNNGTSHNKVALASGVYLELTTEKSTGPGVDEKDWGYITGIVELDLINVQTGVGGGFVYAKNVHGVPSTYSKPESATLTALNADAVTRKGYHYSDDLDRQGPTASNMQPFQTSGNFVHGEQTIIDDCYDIGGKFKGNDRSPAHYWFIKGQVYIYDQYISAFTGAPNAYSETINLPLTITASSNGEMKLLDVQPNYYAYLNSSGQKLSANEKLEVGGKEYSLNDAITWWDYSQLTAAEQSRFKPMTYVNAVACTIGTTQYAAGEYVMDEAALASLRTSNPTIYSADGTKTLDFDFVFRMSNNISHNKGYILTYEVNNPAVWNKWYTPLIGDSKTEKITKAAYDELSKANQDNYTSGPTYSPKTSSIYGQHSYEVADIIDEKTYNTYQELANSHPREFNELTGQATFGQAYLVNVDKLETTSHDTPQNLYKGAPVAQASYTDDEWESILSSLTPAYVCTSTIQLDDTEFIYNGQLLTAAEKDSYIDRYHLEDDANLIKPAYYCTAAGDYGGGWYDSTHNYRGLETWSSMSEKDRLSFTFNYDALDVLIDSLYSKNLSGAIIHPEGEKYQYDSADGTLLNAQANLVEHYTAHDPEVIAGTKQVGDPKTDQPAGYSIEMPVDYKATNGSTVVTYTDEGNTVHTIAADETISREAYEDIPNEQRHYAPISVTEANSTIYVVNTKFVIGESSYAVGQTITEAVYTSLEGKPEKNNITPLVFNTTGTYYYCRERYTIGENGEGQPVTWVAGTESTEYTTGTKTVPIGKTVPLGMVIAAEGDESDEGTYKSLVNKQKGFTINGISPMEYTTFYVSRNSDIYDLSSERIITVIYSYDYEESDESGLHITPVSERHIVNIHLQFKSGIPIVPDITEPTIVLPGTTVSMRTPTPTAGAYEILGGGWELYDNENDKESHTNGIDYTPGSDPLYWYQDGYWVAYYAKTYLGKTYSNAVQVKVANYHDLADVMSDGNKTHHMYIDNEKVKRDPKIYINDYSSTNENGLDLLKNFFDLSIGTTSTALAGHAALDNHVHAGRNLDFILRTDIDHSGSSWTPIGRAAVADDPDTEENEAVTAECFDGTLHGDGHHLSGLDHSLFLDLCGEVYNLGVSGSFTGAGIAETGSGYVENCWVKTSAPNADDPDYVAGTSPAPLDTREGHYAVFGNPTRTQYVAVESGTKLTAGVKYYTSNTGAGEFTATGNETAGEDNTDYYLKRSVVQVVNSYYPESNAYYNTYPEGYPHGKPIQKPDKAFYNGEVAYDLNEFYLFKRYCDNSTGITGNEYNYWTDEGGSTLTLNTGHYADVEGPYLVNDVKGNYVGSYVESRYADGDFVYAAHEIPDDPDQRQVIDSQTGAVSYYPIWPDDYLFFGQALNYGHIEGRTHQDTPSAIEKTDGKVLATIDGNRVYRAPAYFQSKDMGVAHFNSHAVFAQTKKGDAKTLAYPNMTAIDFTGGYESYAAHGQYGKEGTYAKGQTAATTANGIALPARFYPPLLDDDGILDFRNIDETKNLLVYTGTTAPAVAATNTKIAERLPDEAYSESGDKYRKVAALDIYSTLVRGHRVLLSSDSYTGPNDHFLVDKQDFNAPISYTFGNDYRMWYQRIPDKYVDRSKGWEGISIPFEAELVTTQDKGEITHFYSDSWNSRNNNKAKIGHEYWLRNFTGVGDSNEGIVTANFTYPDAVSADGTKTDRNTFLWDYYYHFGSAEADVPGDDANNDDYQKNDANNTYYKETRTYADYPLLAAATPYIIGFPGTTYYEFDLSGEFEAEHTGTPAPAKLPKQTITFASETGITIEVSDKATGVTPAGCNYTFMPNYMGKRIEGTSYALNTAGNSYVIATDAVPVPFRPYFTATAPAREKTRSIIFSNEQSQLRGIDDNDPNGEQDGSMSIYAQNHKIVVTSALHTTTEVRITNTAGITIATFSIEPGETVETRINNAAIYLVQSADGRYIKKLSVK